MEIWRMWKELTAFMATMCTGYKNVWDSFIGEYLKCQRKLSNLKNRYTIAVLCNGQLSATFLRKFPSHAHCLYEEVALSYLQPIYYRASQNSKFFPLQKFHRFNFHGPTPTAKLSEIMLAPKTSGNMV